MKCLKIVSLFVSFIFFPDVAKANFTKQDCIDCCQGLSENQSECTFECHKRWSVSQNYNSRNECNYHCRAKLYGCRQPCLDDCANRYPPTVPGVRAPSRYEKERLKMRKALETIGIEPIKTTTRDPNNTKKRKKRTVKTKKDDGSGTSNEQAN